MHRMCCRDLLLYLIRHRLRPMRCGDVQFIPKRQFLHGVRCRHLLDGFSTRRRVPFMSARLCCIRPFGMPAMRGRLSRVSQLQRLQHRKLRRLQRRVGVCRLPAVYRGLTAAAAECVDALPLPQRVRVPLYDAERHGVDEVGDGER